MKNKKYYVVWQGRQRGIFTNWEDCARQVNGFKGAKYKSFPSMADAQKAFDQGYDANQNQSINEDVIQKSISVDAACSGNPGDMEYRGVWTDQGDELFHVGPLPNGTNNIGEFLAIVHALALSKQKQYTYPIYSDSQIAINWVRHKQARTTIPKDDSTSHIWNLIHRAERWLQTNEYKNKILKWDTKRWGEIKADFGRKS